MKQQNQIIIIAVCVIMTIVGLTYQIHSAISQEKVSVVQEVKAIWQGK